MSGVAIAALTVREGSAAPQKVILHAILILRFCDVHMHGTVTLSPMDSRSSSVHRFLLVPILLLVLVSPKFHLHTGKNYSSKNNEDIPGLSTAPRPVIIFYYLALVRVKH